jgi:hypothetical protein
MKALATILVPTILGLTGITAHAAQGELYNFNDAPAVSINIVSNAAGQFDERGVTHLPVATNADRAVIKAMIHDAGGLLTIVRG